MVSHLSGLCLDIPIQPGFAQSVDNMSVHLSCMRINTFYYAVDVDVSQDYAAHYNTCS